MKLKKLLEGFAWERKPGQPLPTLDDVQKEHSQLKEQEHITGEPNTEGTYLGNDNPQLDRSIHHLKRALIYAKKLTDAYPYGVWDKGNEPTGHSNTGFSSKQSMEYNEVVRDLEALWFSINGQKDI
tara:strand:- start:2754 stop:3131 length:378 start_codon:yes stop_codon:yes gene_type:complete